MLGLPLAFTIPVILSALALLPALYLLLRLTPPRPRLVPLPPLRLIADLLPKEETPARTPPWLLLLRMTVAALLIGAMAGPIWNPAASDGAGKGPLVVVLDDGFPAAPDWDTRIAAARQRLAAAQDAGRLTALVATSEGSRPIEADDAARSLDRLRALKPVSFEPDRLLAMPALSGFAAAHKDLEVVWIADGVERGGAGLFARDLARLVEAGSLTVVAGRAVPLAIAGSQNRARSLDVTVVRADRQARDTGLVRALDAKGLVLGEASFAFGSSLAATATLDLPVELRNDIARLQIADVASAGAVSLVDARGKRRRVAIVSGTTADVAQPLLSPSYYLAKALAPFADVIESRGGSGDPVAAMLDVQPSVLVFADVGAVVGPVHDRLVQFVEAGGVLLRFSGSRLAAAGDDLVPVTLRRGGRTFGGALSWETPKSLAPFDRDSPFAGLPAASEVTVARQVLAEPEAGLTAKTWAQLTDGTPLVTADKRGKGMLVLFHVTADTTWSNLPLSGLFVDMLRRVIDLSGQNGPAPEPSKQPAGAAVALGPTRILDGFGVLGSPPATARPIPASFTGAGTADHPPGLYGPADAALAVNALGPGDTLAPADLAGLPVQRRDLVAAEPLDLRTPLLVLAFVGFLADALASMWLGGGFRRPRSGPAVAAGVVLGLGLALAGIGAPTGPARAEPATISQRDRLAALTTRIGYVLTGDTAVDEASRLGLGTLSRALAERTSLSPGDPVGLDPARDELAFYPMVYWPIVAGRQQPPHVAVEHLAAFMKQGGTVVFDTRDALTSRPGAPPTPEAEWLRTLLAGVDVPELEPVPGDHVITKTFYLLPGFVGRYTTGQTWIEGLPPVSKDDANRPARAGDSVSPIVITSNDLAAAWAADADGEPIYPLVPGGARQREMAMRGGINLVIYTLTGNYKADQVHVRDLLERLAH